MTEVARLTVDQANIAVGRLRELPYGLARTEAVAALVGQIEQDEADGALAYSLLTLVDSMFWSGESTKSLVPFARLIRLWDTRPELFDDVDQSMFFSAFAWMSGGLQDDPSVSAHHIDRLLDDMERRYRVAGRALHAVAYERLRWALWRGRDDVEATYRSWRIEPEGDEDQCEHCFRTRQGIYLTRQGRNAEAVAVIDAPGLPEKGCPTEPADMLSVLALARLEIGDAAGALEAYRAFEVNLPKAQSDMAAARGRRLALLGRGGAHREALLALEEDQDLLLDAMTQHWRLHFLMCAGAALTSICAVDADTPITLQSVPAATAGELAVWVRQEVVELARAFDARGETHVHEQRVVTAIDAPPPPALLDLRVIDADGRVLNSGPLAGDLAEAEDALAGGRAIDAGFGFAEAARSVDLLGDDAGAHLLYLRSVRVLSDAELAVTDLTQVLTAWAPVAVRVGDVSPVMSELDRARGELLAGASAGSGAQRALADIEDCTARLVASQGSAAGGCDAPGSDAARGDAAGGRAAGGDAVSREAAALARQAAQRYAELGDVASAAHSFWLAGQLQRDAGQVEEAVWNLESAAEGFALSRDRIRRSEVIGELAVLLRETGQDLRAEEALASLAPRPFSN